MGLVMEQVMDAEPIRQAVRFIVETLSRRRKIFSPGPAKKLKPGRYRY